MSNPRPESNDDPCSFMTRDERRGWLNWPVAVGAMMLIVFAMRSRPFHLFLTSRVIHHLGKISYSLYIWQQLFLGTIQRPLPLGILQTFPLNIVAVFACAATSYYLLERPFIRIGHSLSARLETPQSQTFEVVEPAHQMKQ